MVKRIMRFRAGLIAATAVLAGAVLAVAPTPASADPIPAIYANLYRYNQTNPIGFECVTDGASGVSMQACDSTTPDDPHQDWAWGYPNFLSNDVFENKATGLCLNVGEGAGSVTMDPCDTSTYPDENWTWNSSVYADMVVNNINGECLNADAVTGSVTMDPCDSSTYPGEIILYLEGVGGGFPGD